MQKYRLKKDLFYTKKGDIVSIPKNPPENYGLRPMYSFSENSEKGKFVGIIHKDDISKWLEEIPETPKSVWDLKEGDKYYFFSSFVTIERGKFSEDEMDYDRINFLNAFITREEAEKELEKRKAVAKIHEYCFQEKISRKYIRNSSDMTFRLDDKNDVIYGLAYRNGNPIGYFSRKNAQKILEKFPEELKLILE